MGESYDPGLRLSEGWQFDKAIPDYDTALKLETDDRTPYMTAASPGKQRHVAAVPRHCCCEDDPALIRRRFVKLE